MSEFIKNAEEKKELMKSLLFKIHSGEDVEKLKREFKSFLKRISPIEIPIIEQELVKDGISAKDIAKLCDLHVELLRGNIEKNVDLSGVAEGHPLHTLLMENEQVIKDAEKISLYSAALKNSKDKIKEELFEGLVEIVRDLTMLGPTHYNREEMLIFPYIERMGITAVPTVLWTKHDEIRAKISGILKLLKKGYDTEDEKFVKLFSSHLQELSRMLVDMVYRENNIFYPTIKVLLGNGEWKAIYLQEKDYGYYKYAPKISWNVDVDPVYPHQIDGKIDAEKLINMPQEVKKILEEEGVKPDNYKLIRENDIKLENGFVIPKEIDLIFRTLPVDITFIDKEDRVRFFSGGERIFDRSRNILGRPVQLCHPPKSVHIVNEILKAFKEKRKSKADFWINFKGRLIYIRYLPIYDETGNYYGTLEVTQDVTGIKKLEGEKRLLDWN